MSLHLIQTSIRAGIWEGILSGSGAANARIEASHQGEVLEGLSLLPIEGSPHERAVRLEIPAHVLSQGVQTIIFSHEGQRLAHVTLVTGVPLEDDLRAELDLLRAELELLKRAFRQAQHRG